MGNWREGTKQRLIEEDAGRSWLMLDRIEMHNEYVVFTRPDGSHRLDLVETFDVFEVDGALWEVQGIDRRGRRAWVERYTPPPEVDRTPAGIASHPLDDSDVIDRRPPWSKYG